MLNWLALVAGISLIAGGARVLLQPTLYLGRQWQDIAKPLTLRQFGIVCVALGTILIIFNLFKFLSE